jgi:hypothetical protein
LNESEVEDWIEEHLDDKPRNLMKERGEYLAHFNSAANGSFLERSLRAIRARARMLVLFLLRLVLIRKRKASASNAMLLFDAGKDTRAGAEFNAIAAEFEKKVRIYEKQVRARHIRHGFNATLGYMQDGSLATGSLEDSDNDGLWTSMYLGGEVFRYAVTKSDDALQNIREAMEAMERLYTINKVKGFPSRSFERRGYKFEDKPWRRAEDPEWDWKSTTSSDEAIGHIFAFGVMAELLDDQ